MKLYFINEAFLIHTIPASTVIQSVINIYANDMHGRNTFLGKNISAGDDVYIFYVLCVPSQPM